MTQADNPHLSSNSEIDYMLGVSGEMGALIRDLDWSATPLGPIEQWPQSLRTAVSICLFSRFPIHIWWGPEFVELYNDAYRPILGVTKHPASLGQPGAANSADIWPIIEPMLRNVYENAVSTWSSNLMLPMDRYGFTEETYFTLSYSPIFVEKGSVGGVFTVVTETTRQVLGERRLTTLHRLSGHTAQSAEEGCLRAGEMLGENREDIPFALIYLLDETGTVARLAGSSGIEGACDLNPAVISLNSNTVSPWKLTEVVKSGQSLTITDLNEHFDTVPPSPWEEPPHSALVLPIFSSGGEKITGFLIGGISARLALDDDYQHFYELIARHIATTVANARAYEEERQRAEALTELDRAKTEFFSNVSHEFRTPLTLMLNPVQEVLQEAEYLSEQHRASLDTAYRNSLRLQKLVNTLLDFSRIESNRIRAVFEPTDLARFTADLASNFRSIAERAGLRLTIDCPPLAEPVYIDREMWEKIVLNLLSNAFKFTFEGEISVALRANAYGVELKICDTGIGIAETDLPHIFERFHRVHGVRSRSYEGSGIGLALVTELVRFHGGQIAVTSDVGTGTTFTISIPFGTAHLPQDQISEARPLNMSATAAYTEEAIRWLIDDVQPESNHHSARYSDAKILVADDNADMRDYLYRLLAQRYQVETVHDGTAALALIEQHPPDLVLADVMMPNLDGFGLVQRIRATHQLRALPVILLSARAGEEARIEGLQSGANDYLVKPFSAHELLARVDAQLQLAQIQQETQARIESIVEGIADPFYALDQAWRFVYINQRAQEMWGKSSADLLGKNIWEIFPQGVNTEAYQEMHRAVAEQHPRSFETFSKFLDAWVDINIYPNRTGLTVYFRNINERKQAEERIKHLLEAEQKARQAAEEANALKLKFLGMISHELRTPLTSIKGFSSTLLATDVVFSPEQQREFIGIIDNEANRLTNLVEQLLDLSRLQSGTLRFEPIPQTLGEILNVAMTQLQTLTVRHRLEIDIPDDLPQIQADPQRIAQVIVNLVGNATKFSPPSTPIVITAAADGEVVQIDVRDQGIGIPPEDRERVFEAFQQVERKALNQQQGTGLGLAICKSIVEAHGGRIWIQDQAVGTMISFVLPVV